MVTREQLSAANQGNGRPVPESGMWSTRWEPFREAMLEVAHAAWAEAFPQLAEILVLLGWTEL